jgi:hypothetical protein
MSWEWEYRSQPPRWTLTLGEWTAVVARTEKRTDLWHASVERTADPLERHEGPTSKDTMAGRTWCLTKMGALRAAKP